MILSNCGLPHIKPNGLALIMEAWLNSAETHLSVAANSDTNTEGGPIPSPIFSRAIALDLDIALGATKGTE